MLQAPTSTTSSTTKKQVVILGAGFAGTSVAKALDEANAKHEFEITVVCPRENFLLHKIGALRAATLGSTSTSSTWPDRVLVPLTHLFAKNQSGRIVRGKAVSVDAALKTVTLEGSGEEKLKWDVLLIATGSTSQSPGEPPASVTSQADTKAYFDSFAQAHQSSKSVLIVGSGPVALELAGELREAHDSKFEIHCVSRAADILDGPVPVRAKGRASMLQLLEEERVHLHLNDEIDPAQASQLFSSSHANWQRVPQEGVLLKSGKRVQCDLVIMAAGQQVNTHFLPQEWLDSVTREVVIDPQTFRVRGRFDVYALGDAAKTDFTKLAYITSQDAAPASKNILLALQNKPAEHKVGQRPSTLTTVISFGTCKGRALLPWFTLGSWLTAMLKSKTMFVEKFWHGVNAGQAPSPA